MSLAGLLNQTVTITTVTEGTTKDAYGEPVPTTTTVTTTGRVGQTQTTENIDDRLAVVSRDVLFLGPDETITPRSKVTVDGVDYMVDGDPSVVRGASSPHHIEVPLRRISA